MSSGWYRTLLQLIELDKTKPLLNLFCVVVITDTKIMKRDS